MANYTETRLKELRQIFQLYVSQGDDKIALGNVGDCLRVSGANPSEAAVRLLTRQLPERILFDDFLLIHESLPSTCCPLTAEEFIANLRPLDKDSKGCLPANQLRRLLMSGCEQLSQRDVDELLAQEVDEHGNVNYVRFVHMIMNG